MNKSKLTLGFLIATVSYAVIGQNLTSKQLAADNVRAVQQMQQRLAIEAYKPTDSDLRDLPPPPPLPVITEEDMVVGMMAPNNAKSLSVPVGIPLQQEMELPQNDMAQPYRCSDNDHVFVGVPRFSQWVTLDDPMNHLYPWFPEDSDAWTTDNGPALETYNGGIITAGSRCITYIVVTNDYQYVGPYADPLDHSLTISYKFNFPTNSAGSTFKCNLTGNALTDGTFTTNLPVATDWTRLTITVPASAWDSRLLCFTEQKGANSYPVGPDTKLDPSVQWCPVPIPEESPSDLWVIKLDDSATVGWNASVFRTNYYSLAFADNVQGPWSTNIMTDVNVVDGSAYAVFWGASTNDARFYRMQHN